MAYRDDASSGENVTLSIYRWAEKEVSAVTPNGVLTAFTIANTPENLMNIKATPCGDYVSGTTYAVRDLAVFLRKNGVDTRQTGLNYTVTPSTKTITFTTAPTTALADSVIVSYAYTNSNDGVVDYTYYLKDYEVNFGDRDMTEVKVCGGKSYKRRSSQGLPEVTLTTIKKDILLSQLLNGDMIFTSSENGVTSLNIKSTVGGSTSLPRCLVIEHTDPDDSDDRLLTIVRNVRGATCNYSGGADAELEETLTVKCNPEDIGDIELTQK